MARSTLSARDSNRLRVGPHGTGSIEFKLERQLPERRKARYGLQIHMVFPTTLGITEELLSRERFYANRRSYLRLHPPQEPLETLCDETLPVGDGGALVRRQHRLFAQRLRHSLAARIRKTRKKMERGERDEALRLFEQVLSQVAQARAPLADVQEKLAEGRLRDVSRACDEWISLEISTRMLQLAYRFQKRGIEPPKSLWPFLEAEGAWRTKLDYPSADLRPETDGADLLTRMSRLKKIVAAVLYLDLENRGPSRGAQDLLFAVAASVAMLWAVGMQFVAWWVGGNPFQAGATSMQVTTFVVVGVLAYAMKDKIKEGLRNWFRAKLPVWLYDREQMGYDDEGELLAKSTETIEYHQLSDLPLSLVAWYENAGALDMPVHVVSYSRRTELDARRVRRGRPDMAGLTEIIRVGVRPWLTHMDGPFEPVWLPRDGQVEKHEAKRIYPVILLMEVTGSERKERFRVERRLELSRQGVEKIRRMAGDEIPAAFAETPTGSLEPIQAEELLPFDPDEEDREGLE